MVRTVSSSPSQSVTDLVSPDATHVDRGVTPRVVALCLVLAVAFGYIIPLIDLKMGNTFLGATHLPPGAIATLLVFVLVVNPLLGRLSSRARLSRNESLVVYISCLFSCLVPGHGSETLFVSNLVGPFYFATRENHWLDYLGPNLKPWFTPALLDGGKDLVGGNTYVQNWYTGLTVGDMFVPWGAWAVPLLAWGSLILACYTMLACLSIMLRAQWGEREALAFPLLRLPIEMTQDLDRPRANPFFRDPVMWLGFGLVFAVQLVRGLDVYFPDMPDIIFKLNLAPMFTEQPWNQLGGVIIYVYPIAVGITFLLTTEVSFSLWFFYWFIKCEHLTATMAGFPPAILPALVGSGGHKVFTGMQVIGAFFAYVSLVLWTGREHLSHIVARAFGRAAMRPSEREEALSYPLAFWGFVGSLLFCIGWGIAAGISPLIAAWMWFAYLVTAIGLSRVIAEGGMLYVQHGWAPLGAWAQMFGSGPGTTMTSASIVPASFVQSSMMYDLRGFLMPSFVQSFKLAHDRGIAARALLGLIAAVTLVAFGMGVWMSVRLGYTQGGLSLEKWYAQGSPTGANAKIMMLLAPGPTPDRMPGFATWFWFGFGALLTFGMMLMRARFAWFPLHPLGYLVSLGYAMSCLWFSIFVGWACKVLITRFGGTEATRRVTPFFLGMVLGDVAAIVFWLLVDGWQGQIGHQLMPD